jgi:hypothetical protein
MSDRKGGDTARREWDKEEFRQKAEDRHRKPRKEQEIPESELKLAKAREKELNLEANLNKTYLISAADEVSYT